MWCTKCSTMVPVDISLAHSTDILTWRKHSTCVIIFSIAAHCHLQLPAHNFRNDTQNTRECTRMVKISVNLCAALSHSASSAQEVCEDAQFQSRFCFLGLFWHIFAWFLDFVVILLLSNIKHICDDDDYDDFDPDYENSLFCFREAWEWHCWHSPTTLSRYSLLWFHLCIIIVISHIFFFNNVFLFVHSCAFCSCRGCMYFAVLVMVYMHWLCDVMMITYCCECCNRYWQALYRMFASPSRAKSAFCHQ